MISRRNQIVEIRKKEKHTKKKKDEQKPLSQTTN